MCQLLKGSSHCHEQYALNILRLFYCCLSGSLAIQGAGKALLWFCCELVKEGKKCQYGCLLWLAQILLGISRGDYLNLLPTFKPKESIVF